MNSERVPLRGPIEPGREYLPTPTAKKLATGQFEDYWILSAAERAKGFVRPVRQAYVHVGPPGPRHSFSVRDLTEEEHKRYDQYGYVQYEAYPEQETPVVGRFWTQQDLEHIGKGCQGTTYMGIELAETFAADPTFYGSTFCVQCRQHFPVGSTGEFVWADSIARVGT